MSLNYRGTNKPGLLSPWRRKSSYLSVVLRNETVKSKSYQVHRLVALAFLGLPGNPSQTVNHKNGVQDDKSDEDVNQIRARKEHGKTLRELAVSFDVSKATVSRIVRGVTRGQ